MCGRIWRDTFRPLVAFPTENAVIHSDADGGVVEGYGTIPDGMSGIKVRHNGGTWQDATTSGDIWTYSLSAPRGTGDFEVSANDGAFLTTVRDVTVGINTGMTGQSNIFGSSLNKTNNTSTPQIAIYDPRPSPMGLMVGRAQRDTWGPAYDEGWIPTYLKTKYDADGIGHGATRFAIGSTKLEYWLPTASVDAAGYGYSVRYYDELVRAIIVSQGLDPATYDPTTDAACCDRVFLQIGEADAKASTSKASFKASLIAFADAIHADLGVGVVVSILQDLFATGYVATEAQLTAIQDAVTEAAAASAYITVGPDFSDVVLDTDPPEQSGNVHFYTDAQVALAASRWSST